MEFNFEDLLYIETINSKLNYENNRYEKLAEIKHSYSNLPQGYLTINK